MRFQQFKEVRHLFPKNSWLATTNASAGVVVDDWKVYVIEGSAKFNHLDLDTPLTVFKDRLEDYNIDQEQQMLCCILVTGNLKAKNIYNYNTDGSTCLVVLGDLEVENMIVGGQEIYVAGDLRVKSCFWGDYHHGTLTVNGTIYAKVFVDTAGYQIDCYRFKTEQKIGIHYRISDNNHTVYEIERLVPVFCSECLLEEEYLNHDIFSWNNWLFRSRILELLANNRSVLRDPIVIQPESEKISKLFTEVSFAGLDNFNRQKENFCKLFDLLLKYYDHDSIVFEWNDFKVYFEIKDCRDFSNSEKDAFYTRHEIKAHRKGGLLFSFSIDDTASVLKKLYKFFGKTDNTDFIVIHNTDELSSSYMFTYDSEYQQLAQELWQEILDRAEKGAYYFSQFREKVTVEVVDTILSLPVVTEKYNDKDKNGFSRGKYNYSFRKNTKKCRASFDIGVQTNAAIDDIRKYYFRFNNSKHPTHNQLFYDSSQRGGTIKKEFSEPAYVSLFDWQLYKEALKWFEVAPRYIAAQNEEYLDACLKEKECLKEQQKKRQYLKTASYAELKN